MEHRRPGDGSGVGGVTGMDAHGSGLKPGTGLMATPDGGCRPVEVPHLDDGTLALIGRSLVLGGQPGCGKSALLNLCTVQEALTTEDDSPGAGCTGAEG